jgi:hypothetical protein
MSNKVYIGHGPQVEAAYELSQRIAGVRLFKDLKKSIFYRAKENGEDLNPTNVFIIQQDSLGRLLGYTSGKDEVYDKKKAQDLLKDPEINPFRIFLAATRGDRVVITIDALAKRVEASVRRMGYEPKLFE